MLRRRSITRIHLLAAVLLLATGCFSAGDPDEQAQAGLREKETPPCITVDDADRLADQVLQLINLERAAANLSPIVGNAELEQIASDYACRMIEKEFFGHRDPETGRGPGDRAVAGKYAFYSVGENLAVGQESAADVMKVWMDSPSHREIILDPSWKEIGIAVRGGGEYSLYWVVEFGDPADFLAHLAR